MQEFEERITQHDKARWLTLSLAQQMGNIGSEVSRAFRWQEKGNREQAMKALNRGLELFDLTLADARYGFSRKKEISRARESLNGYFFSEERKEGKEAFQKYFDAFAREANGQRARAM